MRGVWCVILHKIRDLHAKKLTGGPKLEHNFAEIVAKVEELGWRDGKWLSRCCVE